MRPLDFLRRRLRWGCFGGQRGFGDGGAVSSGSVGQLDAQGGQGQGLSTSVVRHDGGSFLSTHQMG